MAAKLALGFHQALGPAAVISSPWLAGVFGFLTGSANATNGLLMISQAALVAEIGFPLVWAAARQNTAAAALTMLSPARLAMACALVGDRTLERPTYARAWPLALGAMLALSFVALWILATDAPI
jgi:lactate permease